MTAEEIHLTKKQFMKIFQKWPQKWSQSNSSRVAGEKSWTPSDFSWFETLDPVELLFLELFLMPQTSVQRRKKSLAGGPPKIARRAPLRQIWRRVLRTTLGTIRLGALLLTQEWGAKQSPVFWCCSTMRIINLHDNWIDFDDPIMILKKWKIILRIHEMQPQVL